MVDGKSFLEAEYSVIGALCIDPSIAGPLFYEVAVDDFSDATCRLVFSVARDIFHDRQGVDVIAIADRLASEEHKKWLREVMEITPTAAGWKEYAELMKRQTRERKVRELGDQLRMANGDQQPELVQQLNDLFTDHRAKTESLKEGFFAFMDDMNHEPDYIRFGMEPLDDGKIYTELGDVVVLGARPSVGKTAIALQWARYMARDHRVGFYSLETSTRKLMARYICAAANIPMPTIKQRKLRQADWEAIARVTNADSKQLTMDIVPAAGMTTEQIISTAIACRHEIIFIDYLQLISGREPDAYSRVTNISMKLHQFAQRSQTTVFALCQLRRPERNSSRPPEVSDLRESGQIEQDADAIFLMYLADPDNRKGARMLRIAKNKEGELGEMMYDFNGARQRFTYIPRNKNGEINK